VRVSSSDDSQARFDPVPKCPVCKTVWRHVAGSHQPPPMFHPAHIFGPCRVSIDGVLCGCPGRRLDRAN
jgi:hypothetical protein